jgi:SAM-dependent methyltransferase
MRNAYALPQDHDFLWQQLIDLPYFRALLRAVESRFYQDLPIVEPVLDLGSGDGSFAAQTFGRPLDVGLDPWRGPLWESRSRVAHRLLTLAEGAHMPFKDATFRTIVSNSVLEHIPDLEPVIAESYRVLQPGGHFFFCSPSDHFADWLIGASIAGDTYREMFQRISRHQHCDSPQTWRERLERHGFMVEKIWYYFSPKALRVLEIGHYLGLPNLISKKILNQWVVWPNRRNPFLRFLNDHLRPIYDENLPQQGAYLFCIARK